MRRAPCCRGTTTVEFAVVGVAALTLLLGCIEIGRLFFTLNTVAEATRRAARVAAVCPLNDPAVVRAALMTTGSRDRSRFLQGLTAGNVNVAYLDSAGAATTSLASVAYVRVGITGYTVPLSIPFLDSAIGIPPFTTTLPAESLGYRPDSDTRICLTG
jgi:Flp pilus assembly protein TadG